MKRFAIASAGSVALAASVALAPMTTTAAAQVSQSAALAMVIGVEGTNGALFVQAPQLGAGWQSLGGVITGPPAVVALPASGGSTTASPLFFATGSTRQLFMTTLTSGWQPVGPNLAYCIGSPAAVVTGTTLTVACEGTNQQLFFNTTALPAAGLPSFTHGWTSLGGILTAGPAVAPVGGTITFFARGTTGQVFTRTATTGYALSTWTCIGHLAAATDSTTGVTTFGCQGTDHALWEATNPGSGWSAAQSLGGVLIDGPGIAAGAGTTDTFVEGTNGAVFERTASGFTSLGGVVIGGAGAVALNSTAGGAPWGDAIVVPGTAALNTGGVGLVASVSCPSAGNCTAGGSYADQAPPTVSAEAFVADEVNGTWGDAIEVPGTAALNTGDDAFVSSVSCASAGNCVAGGSYCLSSCSVNGDSQAFVADEVNGTWHDATEVAGTAALNTGDSAQVLSVSCASAGNCAAGGYYTDSSSARQAFVADEVNGTWDNAIEVPNTSALNTLGDAEVGSVSCPSAGNCAAGGSYEQTSTGLQAFVADEVNGVWGNAIEVPGTATLNTGGNAEADVSCPSAGNCTAGGSYSVSSSGGPFATEAFVADEVNGVWGNAIEIPGTAALNVGGVAFVESLSCPSAGNCAAGGELADTSATRQAFVVNEVNGIWGSAIEVSGTGTNAGGDVVASVSCPSAGNCAAGGYAQLSNNGFQAFLVSEVNGTWGAAIQVPGLSTPADLINSVSCPPTGSCAAGGEYNDTTSGGNQAFVVSQN